MDHIKKFNWRQETKEEEEKQKYLIGVYVNDSNMQQSS